MASFGVVVFPGTWSERDCHYAVHDKLREDVRYIWHKERDLSGLDCVILPGGFAYGDYLRAGAIARFSPVMSAVVDFANRGGFVIGICNGFQVLCEVHLLPGVLMRNDSTEFRCEPTNLRVESVDSVFTSECQVGQVLRIPVSHGEGNYYADKETLRELEEGDRVLFRYSTASGELTPEANPNGSINNIAGILNPERNVLGMMPHPERSCEDLLGSADGLAIFRSIVKSSERVLAS